MKKQTFTLILFLTVSLIHAQNPLVKQWDKRFGGTVSDFSAVLKQTIDKGYIIGGYSNSGIGGDKTQPNWNPTSSYSPDFWIVKADSLGIKQWDKRFGGNNADVLTSLHPTIDKGFILGGMSNSGTVGDKSEPNWDSTDQTFDYWIVKIDSLGNKQWDKRYGGIKIEWLYSIEPTSDKGYILGRSTSPISGDKSQSNRSDDPDYWIIKIDSIGNKQWDKRFGGKKGDCLVSLCLSNDGGYLLGGYSNSGISGDKTQPNWDTISPITTDYWMVKIDSIGNKQWDKRFGGTANDVLSALQPISDNGYLLVGYSNSGISGDKSAANWDSLSISNDYWIVKIDSVGNKLWDKTFGGFDSDKPYNVVVTADKGFLISGISYSNIGGDKTENNLGTIQTWIIKTDSNGVKQWDKTIFSLKVNYGTYAIQSFDNCYVMASYTNAGIGGCKTQPNWDTAQYFFDYWIVKFCDTTLTTSIAQLSDYPNTFSIYPNPAQSILTIALSKSKKITVINLLGKIMIEKNISSISNGKIDLDISFLPSGIYFIKVDNEVKKFVKE